MTKLLNLPIVQINTVPNWRDKRNGHPTKAERKQAKVLIEACKQYGTAIIRPDRDIRNLRLGLLQAMTGFNTLSEPIKHSYIREHVNPATGKSVKYETGHMPRLTEIAEKTPEYHEYIERLPEGDKPMMNDGRNLIERWMHPVGPRPTSTEYAELNQPAVEVSELPYMLPSLDTWGETALEFSIIIAEYMAIGLGIPVHTFSDLLMGGPHILAPTTVNLAFEYSVVASKGDVDKAWELYAEFAKDGFKAPHLCADMLRWLREQRTLLDAFHNDCNFFTTHAMSNTKALAIFLATYERIEVAGLDPGCLLIQTGRQLRHMTGGEIPAMYHEVTTTPDMIPFVEDCFARGVAPVRVGCPLFVHVASDNTLAPAKGLGNPALYPPVKAGKFVGDILAKIYGEG